MSPITRDPGSDTLHDEDSGAPGVRQVYHAFRAPMLDKLAVFQADLRLVGARQWLGPPKKTNAGTGDQFRRERWANGSDAASCTCDREAEGSGVLQ